MTGTRARPNEIDEELWVRVKGVEGRCFIRGNGHTHLGRFSVWSDSLGCGLSASKDEILECSEASRWWVEGFLNGNEPSFYGYYGRDENEIDVHDDDPRWERLRRARERFRSDGAIGECALRPPIVIGTLLVARLPPVWWGGQETTWLRDDDGGWVLAGEDVNESTFKRGRACELAARCNDWIVEVAQALWICPECGQLVSWA